LVQAVDKAVENGIIKEQIFAQIGDSSYRPRNFESVASLNKETFDSNFRSASCVIGHAGVGTIMMALDCQKPLLVMPRLKKCGEHVNNHQVALARKFEQMGYLLAAYDVDGILNIIPRLRNFVPRKREPEYRAVAARVSDFLEGLTLNSGSI
jgi:UDP-N-acetylglucosamine transferase subunit ALG13